MGNTIEKNRSSQGRLLQWIAVVLFVICFGMGIYSLFGSPAILDRLIAYLIALASMIFAVGTKLATKRSN